MNIEAQIAAEFTRILKFTITPGQVMCADGNFIGVIGLLPEQAEQVMALSASLGTPLTQADFSSVV